MPNTGNELQALKNWLKTACPLSPFTLQALANDASFRRYFRIQMEKQSYIVMLAPPDKENLSAFIAIAKDFLNNGIRTPEIFAYNLEYGYILLSDLGNTLYLDRLTKENADELYTRALTVIPKIQACKPKLLNTQPLSLFNEAFIRFELKLFIDWFLARHLKLKLTSKLKRPLEKVFQLLVNTALEQPYACVHRDYHSRNLLLNDKYEIGVLDFQDALYGPITYDAVSLLRDAYIDWPENQVEKWILNFHQMLKPHYQISQDEFIRWFDLIGVQRHLKILGIFARLCYRDNKAHYLTTNTARLLNYLAKACEKHAELNGLKQLLQSSLLTALCEIEKK